MQRIDYSNCTNKHVVQTMIFNNAVANGIYKVVGLGGSETINTYVNTLRKCGIKKLISYENNFEKAIIAKANSHHIFTKVIPEDIIHAEIEDNTWYDLDFCGTIKFVSKHIAKFKRNSSFTFSARSKGSTIESQLKTFFKIKGESMKKITSMIQIPGTNVSLGEIEVRTKVNKKYYRLYKYRDNTVMFVVSTF